MSTSTSKFPYEKVIEARRVLEVEIAGLAAERRTDVDLAALGGLPEALKAEDLDLERFVEADMAFHRGLAKATQNELLEILADSVSCDDPCQSRELRDSGDRKWRPLPPQPHHFRRATS